MSQNNLFNELEKVYNKINLNSYLIIVYIKQQIIVNYQNKNLLIFLKKLIK